MAGIHINKTGVFFCLRVLEKPQWAKQLQPETWRGNAQGGAEESSWIRDTEAGEAARNHRCARLRARLLLFYAIRQEMKKKPFSIGSAVSVSPLLVYLQVDEEMRRELAELKLVVDKEKSGKGNLVGREHFYKDLPVNVDERVRVCLSISLHRKRKELKVARKRKRRKIWQLIGKVWKYR